jgi:hypothetical protein
MRIVLAPQTEDSEAVLAHLVAWSRASLLRPFCWWASPLGVSEPSLSVRLVSGGEATATSLQIAVTGVPVGDISLVACYPAKTDPGFDSQFAADMVAHLKTVANVLPFTPDHPAEFTMVVIPAAIEQRVPAHLFRGLWAASLYVLPEDSRAPDEANTLVQHEEAFPAHAAHAVATLADLWNSPDTLARPVLTELKLAQSGSLVAPVRMVRCFSRVIDYGYLADEVASMVFQRGDSWPSPRLGQYARPTDPSGLLAELAANYFKSHEPTLGLTKFTPLVLPKEPKFTLLQAVILLVKNLIRQIRGKPYEVAWEALSGIHDRWAEKVERWGGGPEYSPVERLRGRTEPTGLLIQPPPDLDFKVPDGPVADTWSDLRCMAFGLIDGSEVPQSTAGGLLVRNGRPVLVTDPGQIVPDPDVTPPATPEWPEPRACDPLRFDPRFARQTTAGAPEGDADEIPADTTEAGASPFDLEEWVRGRDSTALWIVGSEIARQVRRAEAEAEEPKSEDEPERPSESEQAADEQSAERRAAKHRRADRRHVRLLVLGSILAAAGAGYLAWTRLSWAPRIIAFGVIAIVWTYLMARWARRRTQLERSAFMRVLQEQLDAINATVLRKLRAADVERLGRRYAQYLDWSEIIGRFAHHPWVGDEQSDITTSTPVSVETIPAACSIGMARTESSVDQLVSRARRSVFHATWLTELYESVEKATMTTRYHVATGTGDNDPPDGRLDDPASGEAGDRDSPLWDLDAAVRRGDRRRPRESELSVSMLNSLDEMKLDEAASAVEILPPATAVAPGADRDDDPPRPSGAGAPTVLPSEFLADLVAEPESLSFRPWYWHQPSRQEPLVVEHLPEPLLPRPASAEGGEQAGLDNHGQLRDLAGGAELGRPLRVLVRRVDLSGPVDPARLAACYEPSEDPVAD